MNIELKLDKDKYPMHLDYTIVLAINRKKGKMYYVLEVHNYIVLGFKITLNNLHFVFSSQKRTPFYNLSAGKLKYRNSQKTTPLATRVLSLRAIEILEKIGQSFIHIRLKGFGHRLKIFLKELGRLTKGPVDINPIYIG